MLRRMDAKEEPMLRGGRTREEEAGGRGQGCADAFARLERFNAALLAADSATALLERWCGGAVAARRASGGLKAATRAQRARLEIGANEAVLYRAVTLASAANALCEAQNWYVPHRLGADVLAVLEASDTPFGRAIAGLRPTRETLDVEFLIDRKRFPSAPDAPALRHRALVRDASGRPFAEVDEVYLCAIVAFEP